MYTPLLIVHISAAVVSLFAGYMAVFLKKGSTWHNATGTVFYGSMLTMCVSAAYIATFIKPIPLNVVVSLLTIYLVVTARVAANRRDGHTTKFDVAAMVYVAVVALMAFAYAIGPRHPLIAPFVYFIFGGIAVFCAFTDIRMLKRGGVFGSERIVRHLWRMCGALLIASFSLYPGQAKLFPTWIRGTPLPVIPHLVLLGAMFYWRRRMRVRKRDSGTLPLAVQPLAT